MSIDDGPATWTMVDGLELFDALGTAGRPGVARMLWKIHRVLSAARSAEEFYCSPGWLQLVDHSDHVGADRRL